MHNDLLGIFCNQKIIASNKKSLPENYARFLFCHIGNHANIFIQFGESGSGFKINVNGWKVPEAYSYGTKRQFIDFQDFWQNFFEFTIS